MTSDIPDYTDDEARRRLLRLGEDRLTGAPASPYWPEHPSGWPGQPTVGWAPSGSPAGTSRDGLGSQNGPSPWPASPPQASAARSPASQRMPARRPARLAAKGAVASNALAPVIPSAAPFTMSPSALLPRKGQALSWTALVLGLAAALSVGSGIFAALNSVEFTGHPFIKASHWASFVLFSIVVGLAATMLAVVALFVARPKLTATLALLLCLHRPLDRRGRRVQVRRRRLRCARQRRARTYGRRGRRVRRVVGAGRDRSRAVPPLPGRPVRRLRRPSRSQQRRILTVEPLCPGFALINRRSPPSLSS